MLYVYFNCAFECLSECFQNLYSFNVKHIELPPYMKFALQITKVALPEVAEKDKTQQELLPS